MSQVECQGKTDHPRWPPNGHLSQWMLDQFEPGYQGYCIDVGASDGISINSSWALERSHGWMVLSVEANPDFAERLKRERAWVEICAVDSKQGEARFSIHQQNPEAFSSLRPTVRSDLYPAANINWKTITVPVKTLDQLLEKWEFPKLDILCIDVEGTEVDVMRGCDLEKWQPKVICAESWDAGSCDSYLKALGYKRVARNVHNDLYLRLE